MNENQFRKLTGILLIVGSILVNIPYALLIMNFNYPDILREPAAAVLAQFQAGGASLIFTWLAFAWVGLPLIFATLMLKRVLDAHREQIKEYLNLKIPLRRIRSILNPQLERPITYPAYRYFVRQDPELLDLWQAQRA